MIREEIMPQDELLSFPALAHLAESGFLAPDAWNCRKLQFSSVLRPCGFRQVVAPCCAG